MTFPFQPRAGGEFLGFAVGAAAFGYSQLYVVFSSLSLSLTLFLSLTGTFGPDS